MPLLHNGWTIRDRILTAWANGVTARPMLTLSLALLLTITSILLTATRLEFKSDRSDLIDPALPWQQRYIEFKRQFPRWDDAVVVIDRGETEQSRAAAESFIVELERALARDPRFSAVLAGFPRDDAPPGLIYSQPTARVEELLRPLSQVGPVFTAPSLDALLSLSQLGGTNLSDESRDGLRDLLARIKAAGYASAGETSVLGLDEAREMERLISSTGRLATVLVSLAKPAESTIMNGGADAGVNSQAAGLAALREHLREIKQKPGLSEVDAGVTGVPVLESDETALSMRDATKASILSLSLIAVLLLIAYRGFVVPLFSVISLLVGMAWSFAWATLAIGHLQLLSVTFASMLLGLGIDVAIHIIARLELVHADHDHLSRAIAQAFRGVGPGIVTASFTVAAASAAMALTSFDGVAEMGIIAAGGMILCLISIMSCLPAMLMLLPRPEDRLRSHDGGESRPFMGSLGRMFHSRPGVVIIVGLLVVLVAAWFAKDVRFDSDLQKLMPTSTESVIWQKRLEADDQKSVWHAVVIAKNEAEAESLTLKLRALPEVSDVGGAGMLYWPEDVQENKRKILRSLPDPSLWRDSAPESQQLPSDTQMHGLRTAAFRLSEAWAAKDEALSLAAAGVSAMSDDQIDRAMRMYQRDRNELMDRLSDLRSAEPVRPEQLPAALRTLMIGQDGSLLLRVYPREVEDGSSVLSPARLKTFATSVLATAPTATGPTVQIYESTRLINTAYMHAGLYAFAAILLLLLIDFGITRAGILDTACALLPVLLGSVLMLAVMNAVDVPLNFANMIVMPLIIGIGVGCGVHAVRRWRLQPHDHPAGLAGGSGRAITLTTLTTVIGFAAMMSGEHRGIWSLGFVMSVGLASVWLITILLLPSILVIRGQRLIEPVDPTSYRE